MDFPIQQMSEVEFARLQGEFGAAIVCRNGIYWRRSRPFFYRPTVPVQEYRSEQVQSPCGWPGGFQYVVADPQRANTTMNFLMLEDLRGYSLENMGHKRRNLIKAAARHFQVRPLTDLQQLKDQGYNAFLSFYQRTGYSYRSDRSQRAGFEKWADTLFTQPKTLVLGAHSSSGLVAVSCSYWVNATLIYATLFCESGALRKNVGELLFHELRMLAAGEMGIRDIFVRPYQGGNSLDQYYLLRDCKLVRKPAFLEMPSVTRSLLRRLMPQKYAQLCGSV